MAMEYQQDPLLMGVKYVISLMLSSICWMKNVAGSGEGDQTFFAIFENIWFVLGS
jgi:hypothetical protein